MHFVAVHFERGNGQENAINNIHLAAVYLILQENEVNNMHFVAMHFERGNGQENAKIGRIKFTQHKQFSLLNKQMEVTYIACRSLTQVDLIS
jgi:hypothetical protein